MWTLQKELCKLAGKEDISQALCHLKLLKSPNERYSLVGDDDWVRGGAETYIYRFWVKHTDVNREQEFIIKACVAYSPASQLNNVLEEWIKRRNLLENNGISAPKLITFGQGIIIEEFIQLPFLDALKANPDKLDSYLYQLTMFVGTLNRLNFAPIEPFSDLRSRGDDLVVVDFGEDLGPQGSKNADSIKLFDKLIAKLNDWDVQLNNNNIAKMRSIYQSEICYSDSIHS